MSFQLVYGDHELALPLAFDVDIEDQLAQLIRASEAECHARADLCRRITDLLTALVENNVVPPTDKQVKYAIAIARELSLQLTPEVLQFRDSMGAFLATHAETYRRRKAEAVAEARR